MSVSRLEPSEGYAVPSAEALFLPSGYVQQDANRTLDVEAGDDYWAPWRIEASGKYQRHVYAWAARLVRERGLASVLDVGCGVATKLRELIEPVCDDVVGLDQGSGVRKARELGTRADLRVVDLERPEVELGRRFDLVVCADVLEHLLDPDRTMQLIRSACHDETLVLLSTPDRRRRRGRACMRSEKPQHVREWARYEFIRYVRSRGFEVVRSKLLPQDDSPVSEHLNSELLWRVGRSERSGLACNTLLCRAA